MWTLTKEYNYEIFNPGTMWILENKEKGQTLQTDDEKLAIWLLGVLNEAEWNL